MAISSIASSASSNLTQASVTGMRQMAAANLLKDMDADQNGSVSMDEFVAFGEKLVADSSSSTSATSDPADTNKDGTVSASEKLLYEMTHPTSSSASSNA